MKWYYPATGKQTATAGFTVYHVGFKAANVIIINDDGINDIEFSWDGSNTHGHVIPGEPLNLGDVEFEEIWIKGTESPSFRIWAYAK